jgi:methionine sulfoxide reductase heme-binding subunit
VSVQYQAIQWNPFKRRYDLLMATLVAAYLVAFVAAGKLLFRGDHAFSDEVLLIRALGTGAFLLLNLTLCIGPLARIDQRFLPLLYNRRHLGVTTFGLAAAHAALAVGYYHGFSDTPPLISLLTSNTRYGSLSGFPFEIPGLMALLILLLMCTTSHDFWLRHLTPRTWKRMHRLVYLAWGLLVMHVALGSMQSRASGVYVYSALMGGLAMAAPALHLIAFARRGRRMPGAPVGSNWIDIGTADAIPDKQAVVVDLPDRQRVAIFRFDGRLAAISNVCAHQGGPLGEGRIIDGCITCPWHGYQYLPETGCAPPPFPEKLATFRLRVEGGRVWIDPSPLPPGESAAPVCLGRLEEEVYV